MKDYKIKEALCNLRQSMDSMKANIKELSEKFEVMIEILDEDRRMKEEEEVIGGTE